MRILYDNLADTLTTLTATNTVGSLPVTNLRDDTKSLVWRATGTSAVITTTFPKAGVRVVAFPFTTMTKDATMRVVAKLGAIVVYDSGAELACLGAGQQPWAWAPAITGANSFAYGGGSYACIWMAALLQADSLEITLNDPTNPAGYIEASRLVFGDYWQPSKQADYGASLTAVDRSTHFRTDAGDLRTDLGTRSRQMQLPLSQLTPIDREMFWQIAMRNGLGRPMLISLYPYHDDVRLEQAHTLWCKSTSLAAVTTPSYRLYASSLAVEEM